MDASEPCAREFHEGDHDHIAVDFAKYTSAKRPYARNGRLLCIEAARGMYWYLSLTSVGLGRFEIPIG